MNATHCLCYISDLTTTAYNFSFDPLQCLANQVTQSPETNRTVWNIVWSSLTTIFACTWVSCHPNLDFDNDVLMKMKMKQKQQKQEQQEQEEWEQKQRKQWEQGGRKRQWLEWLERLTHQEEQQKRELRQWEQDWWEERRQQECEWQKQEWLRQYKWQEWEEWQQQEKEDKEDKGEQEAVNQRGLERSRWSGLQELLTRTKIILVTLIKWCWSSRRKIITLIKWCWPSNRMMTRVKIILVALIAPEFIVMWALRQYMVARDIVKSYKGWSMSHAFFSLMGGFVIADKEQDPICALVLIPHTDYTFWRMLDASRVYIEDSFKISISAKMSIEASTLNVDVVAETLADLLVGEIWEVVVGQGLLASGALFEYKEALRHLQFKALQTIDAAFNKVERELANDLNRGSLNRRQKDLWDNCKDEIRAILQDRVPTKILDMHRNIRKALVFCPKEEIEDKTKRDWLAKTFALAQTTWFVVQCIARRVQHLPLTEIELMTCAYAALSAVIYAFWWHKPFGVQFPIIVPTEIPHRKRERHPTIKFNLWDKTALAEFLAGSGYDEVNFRRRVRVPTFYSGYFGNQSNDFWNFIAEVATAAAFGGIHLFAWNYQFPTRIELWLWRVSALVIVGVPPIAIMPISILTGSAYQVTRRSHLILSKFFLPILVLSYIIARLSIFVLSLIALRRLPVGTLTNIDWLTFIPHID